MTYLMVDFYYSILVSAAFLFALFQTSETLLQKIKLHVTLSSLDRIHWVQGDERKALTSLQNSHIAPTNILWEDGGQTAVIKTPLSNLISPETFEFISKNDHQKTFVIREHRLIHD